MGYSDHLLETNSGSPFKAARIENVWGRARVMPSGDASKQKSKSRKGAPSGAHSTQQKWTGDAPLRQPVGFPVESLGQSVLSHEEASKSKNK